MAINEQQRNERRKYLGSSDMAAVLGLDPWRTPADVYLSKVNELDDEPSEQMQWGTLLEPVILDEAERRLGALTRNVLRIRGVLCANHDALLSDKPEGVEVKTSGQAGEWGESNTDQIPAHYIVQCQHQMLVSNLRLVHVPVLFADRGLSLRMFRVERNDDLCATIEEAGREFWMRFVETRTPPDDFAPSIEVAKAIRREPGKVIQIPVEPVQAWLSAKEAARLAGEDEENAKALLLAYMGDAEAADTPLGRINYLMQERAGYTVAPTSFRVLRHVKSKEKKHGKHHAGSAA